MNTSTYSPLLAALCLAVACSDSTATDDQDSTSGMAETAGTSAGGETDAPSTSADPSMTSAITTDPGTDTVETSTGPDEITTGQFPGCGNEIVEMGEACDDGNEIDGDGCNADCQPSGAVLWRWSSGGSVDRIAAAPDDTVYAAVVERNAEITIVHLSADGDVLEEQAGFAPAPVGDEQLSDLTVTSLAVVDGSPVVASDATFETDGVGFVRVLGSIERLGAKGWIVSEDDRFSIRIDTTPDGDVLGSDNATYFKYTASGDESWRNVGGGARSIVATPSGQLAAIDREEVAAFNNDGTAAWNLPVPAPDVLDGLRAIANAPDGALLVMQEIKDGASVLRSVDAEGTLVETDGVRAWPNVVAADAVGNVFWRPDNKEGSTFSKRDQMLEQLWVTDLGEDTSAVEFAEVDGQGQAIVLTSDGEVIKLAL